MLSEMMDLNGLSSSSSFFSEELCFPNERETAKRIDKYDEWALIVFLR